MSDAITAETTVEIDYSSLVQTILEESSSDIDQMITDAITENIGEHIEDYMRYSYDMSSEVSEAVGDAISENLDDLLGQVSEGSLCSLGNRFKDAVWTILKHHIEDWDDIFEGEDIGNGNGASTEDIQKMVAEKFNKEMKVEVTFVDKEPAAVVSGEMN